MPTRHAYEVTVRWEGDRSRGTTRYREYTRDHQVAADGRPPIPGSSDPMFRGSPDRWNPEQLLLAAVAQCHMLEYLHRAMLAGVVVTAYRDDASGALASDGTRFEYVVLRQAVEVADASMVDAAVAAHEEAHARCLIARSVAFPVRHEPTTSVRP
ncbi:MAG TPA: OsmC family protein [Acidimicrobiales bacterium]|nr:OsmC family protein [Acidimicrobiales bacterium]